MYPAGSKVELREFAPDDLAAVSRIESDPRVTVWLSYDTKTLDQTRATLLGVADRAQCRPRAEYYLAVVDRHENRLVGAIRLGLTGVKAAKLGYAIAADDWGKGYATDAIRAMLAFGFGELELHRVSAAIGPDNRASIAVVTKLGFRLEGRLRDHVFTNGAWRDSLLFAKLRDER